jgi:hypothetical protein
LKPLFPDSFNAIAAELKLSQRCTMPKHSCKTPFPGIADASWASFE